MTKIIFIRHSFSVVGLLSIIGISAIALNSCTNGNATSATSKENITFYEVPLICGAHAEIGCGSRAKPALIDLEKSSAVKEAWLNRPGTVFAIVWTGSDQTKKVAKPVFEKYQIDFTELKGEKAAENEATFRQESLWYKGTDVDKLSIEEAEHIATTLVSFALEKNLITPEEAGQLKPAVQSYFKTELVKVRTPGQLYDDSENKFRIDLAAISASIMGKERTEKITEMYYKYREEEGRKIPSSCTKKSNDPCCKKK